MALAYQLGQVAFSISFYYIALTFEMWNLWYRHLACNGISARSTGSNKVVCSRSLWEPGKRDRAFC